MQYDSIITIFCFSFRPQEARHLVLLTSLADVNIYVANNAKKRLGATNNFCFCLKVSTKTRYVHFTLKKCGTLQRLRNSG